jgi:hypothetical protein
LKNKIALVFLAVVLLVSCACGRQAEDTVSFDISIKNECSGNIYGLHYEYYIGDAPAGGGMLTSAGGGPAPIGKGEVLAKEFGADDLPQDAALSSFKIIFYAVLENGGEFQAGAPLEIDAAYGQTYEYTLTGDSSTGFELTEMEN